MVDLIYVIDDEDKVVETLNSYNDVAPRVQELKSQLFNCICFQMYVYVDGLLVQQVSK